MTKNLFLELESDPEINIFYELENFEIEHESLVTTWIEKVLYAEKKELGYINYIFCNDDYILDINKTYLQHDYFTDIITFDYNKKKVESDIYISIDRIKENATDLNVEFRDELLRVIVHGALHLCGYKDKTKEQEVLIRSKEDHYVHLFLQDQNKI
jgi:probable rRNA maturation factor